MKEQGRRTSLSVTPSRPVFLDLRRIRLPVTAWVSILHRISGVLLVLALPWGAWLLIESLSGEAGYARVVAILQGGGAWPALLALWALGHHVLAGLRHLAMDLHWGMGRAASLGSARWVLAADLLLLPLLWGVWS